MYFLPAGLAEPQLRRQYDAVDLPFPYKHQSTIWGRQGGKGRFHLPSNSGHLIKANPHSAIRILGQQTSCEASTFIILDLSQHERQAAGGLGTT